MKTSIIKPDKDAPGNRIVRIEKLKEDVGIKQPSKYPDWHKEKLTPVKKQESS